MKFDVLEAVRQARAENRRVVVVTNLTTGDQRLVRAGDELASGAGELARKAFENDQNQHLEMADGQYFAHVFSPPPRLILVGAVHIAEPLNRIARLADYRVTLIDPRTGFVKSGRFPRAEVLDGWPDKALTALYPDSATAVVTLTHDPKLDDPALAAALRSPAFYIGALGSRKTHDLRCLRLAEMGFSAMAIARVRGPVGLAIGARSPSEIAISIMAELTAARRGAAVRASSP